MKFWGMVLIVASCSGLGFQLAFLYSRRVRECRQIEQSLQRLLGEIRFHQLPLTEALRETGQAAAGTAFAVFLLRVAEQLEAGGAGRYGPGSSNTGGPNAEPAGAEQPDMNQETYTLAQLWQWELDRFARDSLLGEEQELLRELGQELGVLDLEAQVGTLQHCLEQWRGRIEELQRQEEAHGRLYRGVGVSAGVFLAILLL